MAIRGSNVSCLSNDRNKHLMVAKKEFPYTGSTTNVAAYRECDMGKKDRFNVDIMYSVVGGAEPPELPLRQEMLPQGIEMVYNAKGVGQKVVCKEQERRENFLLKKLRKIETKLEKKRSYRRTSKREQALSKITELRIRMEHCARTISYAMYLDELRRLNGTKNDAEVSQEDNNRTELEDLKSAFTNHDGSVNTDHVEIELQEVLDMLDESGSQVSSFLLSDIESNDDIDDSLLSDVTITTVEMTDISAETDKDEIDRSNATFEKRESPVSSLISERIDDLDNINDEDINEDHDDKVSTAEITDISAEIDRDDIDRGNATIEKRESPVSSLISERIDAFDYINDEDDNEDDDDKVSFWNSGGVDGGSPISGGTHRTSASVITAATSNATKKTILKKQVSTGSTESFGSVVKSSSSSSVRFKDVKLSLEDNLARARALIENARIVQRNFSNDSNCSSIKPSDSYTNGETPGILDDGYTPERERYHLFVSYACPWSHRALIMRAVKGLEDTIGISYIKCSWKPQPLWNTATVANPDNDVSFWSINEDNEAVDDEVLAVFRVNYLTKSKNCTKVPVLWDRKTKTVVGNTSAEIMWMLNFNFNKWAKKPKLNLFPAGRKGEIDETNRWLHDSLSVGVYQCGLATSQHQYDDAIQNLTDALDKAEQIIQKRGFLNGNKLTASDVRLFVVLIRMDEIYRVLFHTNTRRVSSLPGLMEYVKDIYHVKGVRETCDVDAMKIEYFGARTEKGREFIIPHGGVFMKMLDERE